jgi:GNAT superfamily N-acetyltransferase
MNSHPLTRWAILDDARWIVELSARVQEELTASGSLQQIGPLPLQEVERLSRLGCACVLELADRRIGSTLLYPIESNHPELVRLNLHHMPGPLWNLRALMLEPQEQGKGLGLHFLEGIRRLVIPASGSILLGCWAGNAKLRDFYRRAGYTFHGIFPEKDYEIAAFSLTSLASPVVSDTSVSVGPA